MTRKNKIIRLNDYKRKKLFEVIIDSFDRANFKATFSDADSFVYFLKSVVEDLRRRR